MKLFKQVHVIDSLKETMTTEWCSQLVDYKRDLGTNYTESQEMRVEDPEWYEVGDNLHIVSNLDSDSTWYLFHRKRPINRYVQELLHYFPDLWKELWDDFYRSVRDETN